MSQNRQTSGLEDVLSAAEKVKGAAKVGKAIANIAKGAASGGLAGATAEAVKSFKKELLIVIIVLLVIPVLFLTLLPTVIFNGLNPPDTGDPILNDDPQVVENVSTINSSIGAILTEAYNEALAEAKAKAAALQYAEVVDPVGGNIVYNANQILCWYSASQDETVDNISIPHLSSMVEAHKDQLYYYTVSYEQREETGYDEYDRPYTYTVTYTIFTIQYAGEEYFPT